MSHEENVAHDSPKFKPELEPVAIRAAIDDTRMNLLGIMRMGLSVEQRAHFYREHLGTADLDALDFPPSPLVDTLVGELCGLRTDLLAVRGMVAP